MWSTKKKTKTQNNHIIKSTVKRHNVQTPTYLVAGDETFARVNYNGAEQFQSISVSTLVAKAILSTIASSQKVLLTDEVIT